MRTFLYRGIRLTNVKGGNEAMQFLKRVSRAQLNLLAILLNIIVVTIGFALYASDADTSGLIGALGSGLIASGLAALILTVYQIAASSVEQKEDALLAVAKQVGLRKLHTRRPNFRMDGSEDSFNGARIVEILAITAHSLFPHVGKDDWALKCPKATVRIMLLHPFYPAGSRSFADQRDLEEQHTIGTDRSQINDFVKKFGCSRRFEGGGNYELRLARRMPTVSMFRIDDRIYWAPYIATEYGPGTPHLEVEKGGVLFGLLEEHFERLWDAEEGEPMPLPTDDLDQLVDEWRNSSDDLARRKMHPTPGQSQDGSLSPAPGIDPA